jgi:hypothetical protein
MAVCAVHIAKHVTPEMPQVLSHCWVDLAGNMIWGVGTSWEETWESGD